MRWHYDLVGGVHLALGGVVVMKILGSSMRVFVLAVLNTASMLMQSS